MGPWTRSAGRHLSFPLIARIGSEELTTGGSGAVGPMNPLCMKASTTSSFCSYRLGGTCHRGIRDHGAYEPVVHGDIDHFLLLLDCGFHTWFNSDCDSHMFGISEELATGGSGAMGPMNPLCMEASAISSFCSTAAFTLCSTRTATLTCLATRRNLPQGDQGPWGP